MLSRVYSWSSLIFNHLRHLHGARRDKSLASAALDREAATTHGRPDNAELLVFLLALPAVDELVAQLDENFLQLLVFVALLLVLLLEQLLSLQTLLKLPLSNLIVNLENGALIDRILIHLRDLLHASLK